MKTPNIIIAGIILCSSFILSEEYYTPEQKQELGQKALHKMLQKIYTEAMAAKRAYLELQSRDIGIENFAIELLSCDNFFSTTISILLPASN